MSLGYHEQIEGGRHGTSNPPIPSIGNIGAYLPTDSDPASRAALQEAAAAQMALLTTTPGYTPPTYVHQGMGALPKVGWTVQKNAGEPVFPPYTPTSHIPDWTGDVSNGGGAYDQGPVMTGQPVNPLNRAPMGEEWSDSTPPNPNQPKSIVSSPGDREW